MWIFLPLQAFKVTLIFDPIWPFTFIVVKIPLANLGLSAHLANRSSSIRAQFGPTVIDEIDLIGPPFVLLEKASRASMGGFLPRRLFRLTRHQMIICTLAES